MWTISDVIFLKSMSFHLQKKYLFVCVFALINDLWKGVLVKHHLKVYSILARLRCCFWYPITWSRICNVISVEEVKISHTVLDSKCQMFGFAIYCVFFSKCFAFLGMIWQLHTPCGILCQMQCHLDSRGRERIGMRMAVLSLSLEVLKDKYFHSILQPKQYHRFKHMIWIGFWFITFVPARKFDLLSGKPGWGRLGAWFQVNIKFI